MQIIERYFPEITPLQKKQFGSLREVYTYWNDKINVISRKDIDHLYERHILHALGIAKVQPFLPNTKILDIGTGGGFPGIPLAILYPETDFYLIDAIGKKIKVVENIAKEISLKNVKTTHERAENITEKFDFIISRAVTHMEKFVPWVKNKMLSKSRHALKNGILYLKGGNLQEELVNFPNAKCYELACFFKEDFFTTKKVVHLSF